MDVSKTYYRLIKKQETPKQPSGYAVKKKSNPTIRKYVIAYGEGNDKTFQI